MRPAHPQAHTLGQIADRLQIDRPQRDAQVTGLVLAAAAAQPGDIFAALPGQRTHGAKYAGQARDAGAVAILTDDEGARLVQTDLPVLRIVSPRQQLGEFAAWLYGFPARQMRVAGITGTNGKTTVTYLLDAAFATRHRATALLGTIETRVAGQRQPSARTTLEAPALQAAFAYMREQGVGAASMEISSHALALHRVDGLQCDVAGFTNLSRDHLDFHGSMAGYFADKAKLFTPTRTKRAVVCVDDEWGRRLAEHTPVERDTVRAFGQGPADWWVSDIVTAPDGHTEFRLHGPDGIEVPAGIGLPGGYNVANAAIAAVMAYRAGIEVDVAARAIAGVQAVPGRMERVAVRGPGPLAVVDFAHTPESVAAALAALRPLTPGKLLMALGCGGQRDQGKRPLMGKAAADGADLVVVTDDNPRNEPPEQIRAEVLSGARGGRAEVLQVAPRAQAIATLVQSAGPQDTILVVGKGHETTQTIGDQVLHFDDREELAALLAERWS